MSKLFWIAPILAALASAPFAWTRRDVPALTNPPEIVSLPEIRAARRGSLAELDLRPAWGVFVAARFHGVPVDGGSRFLDAFFDGRLPEAAEFARVQLAALEPRDAIRIADRARSFDRALVRLAPAPDSLLRVLVERAEDPEAHRDAIVANESGIARLVGDAELGERAFALLRTTGRISAATLEALAGRLERDAWARSALSSIGAPAVPLLLEALDSADGRRRAAAAWILAGVAGSAHAERILQAALPELARDSVSGNAGFAVKALAALGERARPAARGLLKSADDQAVAGALQVLLKTGGASPEDIEAARARVERLAARAGDAGDEASIGIDVRASLGVALGAMPVADPPERLNPSQTGSSVRDW